MRLLIENIITEKDAAYLLSLTFNRNLGQPNSEQGA